MHFDAKMAFDFPPGAFDFSIGFLLGLGAATRIGVYDYLGYYDICYIGDEVKDPGRAIPRSIIISVLAVAAIYFAINLSIIGVVPWREFVPADARPGSDFVVSTFMEKIYGSKVATAFTAMILWTAFGSVFALLLGYSRIPYAAAQDGYFFKIFGRLHPQKNFPYVSLIVIGMLSIACSFFSLGLVIDALITTRILIQFIGQIFAVMLLRRRAPGHAAPVSNLVLSDSEHRRARRLGIHLRDIGFVHHSVRAWDARARRRVFLHLVMAHCAVALRRNSFDGRRLSY